MGACSCAKILVGKRKEKREGGREVEGERLSGRPCEEKGGEGGDAAPPSRDLTVCCDGRLAQLLDRPYLTSSSPSLPLPPVFSPCAATTGFRNCSMMGNTRC
jgi:hypothetical protein